MRAATTTLAVCLAIGGLVATNARASQPIESFTAEASGANAGTHPDLGIALDLGAEPAQAASSLTIDWPGGVTFLPRLQATCSTSAFAHEECPSISQVGLATVYGEYEEEADYLLGTAAVYLLIPAEGEFGRLGFWVPTVDDQIVGSIELRSASDYGARMTLEGFPEDSALQAIDLTLWGVPAKEANDEDRFPKGTTGCPGLADASCNPLPTGSSLAQVPFIGYPTECELTRSNTVTLATHEDPEQPTLSSAELPVPTSCDLLAFNPSATIEVSTSSVSTPTALDLKVNLPQPLSANFPSPSQLREVAVGFFGGLEVDGTGLLGREACSSAQAGLGSEAPPACPGGSLLAAAEVVSPLLPGGVGGAVFYGGPDPEGGYRLYLLASAHGVDLKLPMFLAYEEWEDEGGEVFEALTASLPDLPQLPIEQIVLHFPGGASSPLVTGDECGDFPIWAEYAPWADPYAYLSEGTQTLDSGAGGGPCPVPLAASPVQPPVLPVSPRPATAPQATIVRHPPRRSKKRRVRFAFRAGTRGARFRCKLDRRRYRPCTSPVVYKSLKPGHHVFQVYAIGPDGRRGKTTKFPFKTVKPQARRHKKQH
jgi:hypothetical protein